MFLVVTRTFPPEVGGMQNLMWGLAKSLAKIDLIKVFEKGLDHYFKQEWDNAIIQFKESENLEDDFKSRNTTPSKIYIERCDMFINNPPGEDWDGVWRMTTK